MKKLTIEYSQLESVESVAKWMKKKDDFVENRGELAESRTCLRIFLNSIIPSLVLIIVSSVYYDVSGLCYSVIAAVTAIITLSIHFGNRSKQRVKDREIVELNQDPMYIRAKQIVQAYEEYWFHYNKYQYWYNLVINGYMLADHSLSEQYVAFIERAHSVLMKAIYNFNHVVWLMEQANKLQQASQRTVPDTSLSELIAKLDESVEVPKLPLPNTIDPSRALEYDEALRELDGFLEGKELANKIDRAVQKAGIKSLTKAVQ